MKSEMLWKNELPLVDSVKFPKFLNQAWEAGSDLASSSSVSLSIKWEESNNIYLARVGLKTRRLICLAHVSLPGNTVSEGTCVTGPHEVVLNSAVITSHAAV